MRDRVDFKELEKNNLLSIILYLDRAGRSRKTALYDNVSRTNTMPQKVDRLIQMGLVSEDPDVFDNNSKFVELTDLGRRVAARIRDIEDIINGDMEDDEETNHGTLEEEGAEVRQ